MPQSITYKLSAVLLIAASGLRAGAVLTLNPANGAMNGQPGQSIAWGFTITNDTNFLVVNKADYLTVTPLGTFTDFVSSFFTVVGPGTYAVASWTQPGDVAGQTGIGSYAIDSSTAVGSLSTGTIVLDYDLYSVSPNNPMFDPSVDYLGAGSLSQAASVLATPPGDMVPEPASSFLMLAALAALIAGRISWRRLCGHPGAEG